MQRIEILDQRGSTSPTGSGRMILNCPLFNSDGKHGKSSKCFVRGDGISNQPAWKDSVWGQTEGVLATFLNRTPHMIALSTERRQPSNDAGGAANGILDQRGSTSSTGLERMILNCPFLAKHSRYTFVWKKNEAWNAHKTATANVPST